MSNTQTDSFLSGQGIAVEPAAIERELTRLWGPAAERVGGPEAEHPTVTRVVLANLVVETRPDDAARVAEALDVVVALFPCRAIVAVRTDTPGRTVSAEVAALCHLPAPGMPQICSERILLRVGPEATDLLPGAIRPLLEPDLPVVLWWTSDPKKSPQLYTDLAGDATRILLDLNDPDPGCVAEALAFGLDAELNPYSRDTAWLGLTRWRELIAQCFESPCGPEILKSLTSVAIRVSAPTAVGAQPPRPAVWLAAWLAGQLDWKPGDSHPTPGPGPFLAEFQGPKGPVRLSIEVVPGTETAEPRLLDVLLTAAGPAGDETFRFRRTPPDASGVQVEICSTQTCELSRVVEVPEPDVAHRISAGIESARNDAPSRRALPIALWLLRAGGSGQGCP